ncbi:6-phospho-3-hexuloisomerase [Cypionkella sp.]|uniref:6-phospho-3-hexuloisomerase n=1 Tax=Cypionkella sp. TaxID=2811411 RepID=UPI002AB90980|nr:6-phospho-3-hexuloisomerase [Cypionkella sp.]MDZ4391909.1 6-phospho-3-hexuloisomerase [Cypionkella sp.]
MKALMQAALAELGAVADRVDEAAVQAACVRILSARRVMLYGCGREGLMMRALAMRLYHLGVAVSMQGDLTAPPLGVGDLFFAACGPGELSTVTALAGVAKAAGAGVLMVTAEVSGATLVLADQVLVIPAQTMASDMGARDLAGGSVLPMGSLFEGAMFLVFEIMVLRLRELKAEAAEAMRARHTNME